MIESVVFFLLGALAASLIALLLAPILGRRTARLVERRMRASLPIALSEIQAQKDLLRADFAVQLRRLEVRFDEVRKVASERQIELGRRDEKIRELGRDLAGHRELVAELETEIEDLKGTVLGLEKQVAEQAQSLREKQRAITAANDALRERTAAFDEVSSLADSRKVEIVALKTQVDNLQDRIEDLRAELAVKSIESEQRAATIDDLTDQSKARDAQIARQEAQLARRREIAAARRQQVGDLRAQIASGRAELAVGATRLAAAEEAIDAETERRRRLDVDAEMLRQRIADLEATLELRDRELSRLRGEGGEASRSDQTRPPAGDAADLRDAISALAARIVSQTAASGDDEVRKLISAVSADGRKVNGAEREDNRDRRTPLAERIKEADLQPGE